ncbi:MAG TPA: LLM class flavin-dependent oxidoreductase [Candidatus Elarobacter sp.]
MKLHLASLPSWSASVQVPLSILDLAPIVQGGDARRALQNARDLAQHAERWGYHRFWLAEHHNMTGIASAATAVVIGYVADATSTIRVGSGGVMLPNHAPLVIAEQFGTLAALYPGRIDLGLGRAPGTDRATMYALRRSLEGGEDFPHDVVELQSYFRELQPGQAVRAVPGAGLNVPIWLLGSSLYSAQLAAALGLPFAFASHFAPAYLHAALAAYRAGFRPSEQLAQPYAMVAANVVAADTDEEARRLFTSLEQRFVELRRTGNGGPLPPPVDPATLAWGPSERSILDEALACSIVGSRETVRAGMEAFVAETQADELIVTAHVYDHAARLRSFEIAAEAAREAGAALDAAS